MKLKDNKERLTHKETTMKRKHKKPVFKHPAHYEALKKKKAAGDRTEAIKKVEGPPPAFDYEAAQKRREYQACRASLASAAQGLAEALSILARHL